MGEAVSASVRLRNDPVITISSAEAAVMDVAKLAPIKTITQVTTFVFLNIEDP